MKEYLKEIPRKRIFEEKVANEYSKYNPKKNIRMKICERIFERKSRKEYLFAKNPRKNI